MERLKDLFFDFDCDIDDPIVCLTNITIIGSGHFGTSCILPVTVLHYRNHSSDVPMHWHQSINFFNLAPILSIEQ